MEDYLTTAEVAELYRVTPATLRFWRHRDVGPNWAKIGRRVIYRESDVRSWMDRQFEAQRQERSA